MRNISLADKIASLVVLLIVSLIAYTFYNGNKAHTSIIKTIDEKSNLEQVKDALGAYARLHHGTMPPMQDERHLQASLVPGFLTEDALTSALDNRLYQTNPSLSQMPYDRVQKMNNVAIVYGATATRQWYKGQWGMGRFVLLSSGSIIWATDATPQPIKMH